MLMPMAGLESNLQPMTVISASATLFLMMDPIGNVPVFATLLKDVEPRRRSAVVIRENLIALATLLGFLILGPLVMGWLHIGEPALNIAGGAVLLMIALQMIFPSRAGGMAGGLAVGGAVDEGEPFIVPLAIPLIAGPATMAVVMLMATREPERRLEWVLAILIAWVLGLCIHLLAGRLRPLLGPRGLLAAERLMGMILLVMAVQMGLSGCELFVHVFRK